MSVRLVHLSDVHFGGENVAATEAAIAGAWAFAPDLVVVTGDLTLNGLPAEFIAARAWLARLPAAVVTPGNHDTPYWNLPLRAASPFGRYRRYIGASEWASAERPGLSVRAVNTARGAQPRPNWSRGAINLRQIDRASAELAAAGDSLKVFACHHPLVELEGAPVKGGVHRGAAAARSLAAAGVDLILTGHVHNPFAIALPHEDHRTYAVGAGTLSLRTRGTPAGYSTIVAEGDTVKVTAMGWNGAAFAAFQTWDLPLAARGRVVARDLSQGAWPAEPRRPLVGQAEN